jgi:prepilin-type N-terminal cleavage/methylation domain-containing protein
LSLETCPLSLPRHQCGFTLLELLVVVGLIAALSFFLLSSLSGGGQSAALQTAQATLANLVSAARVKAFAGGGGARLLVNVDPASAADPARFLRYAAIQVQVAGVWQPAPVVDVYLPEGLYVVPGNFTSIPAGLFSAGTATPWTKSDGSALRSTALRANQVISATINSLVAEQWVCVSFASAGTTAQSGDIILASGRRRQPGSFAEGESPVELENPETVRGLTLSTYGLPALINDRASF